MVDIIGALLCWYATFWYIQNSFDDTYTSVHEIFMTFYENMFHEIWITAN